MKNRIKTTLQLILFLAAAGVAIYYIMNTSPLESMHKESISKPSRTTPPARSSDTSGNSSNGDDVSLTGEKGRYEEARIGRKE